jgi:hypothetical protein
VKAPAHHGVRAKHASHKHAAKSKHTAKTAHKPARKTNAAKAGVGTVATHAKARKLTPDSLVALCSARAVAESLRVALGVVASDDDVLELYFRTADDPDDGASILATLHAAATFGLAGYRLPGAVFAELDVRDAGTGAISIAAVDGMLPVECAFAGLEDAVEGRADVRQAREPRLGFGTHALILGLVLPEGDHAVLATPDAWWSWGKPFSPSAFPGAVIDEAWPVTWS